MIYVKCITHAASAEGDLMLPELEVQRVKVLVQDEGVGGLRHAVDRGDPRVVGVLRGS